jgi:hypothetical protein
MPDLKTLSTGTKIVLAAGLLLLIDTFFAWQEVSASIGGVEVASASANAWHGFWGVVMGLMRSSCSCGSACRSPTWTSTSRCPTG